MAVVSRIALTIESYLGESLKKNLYLSLNQQWKEISEELIFKGVTDRAKEAIYDTDFDKAVYNYIRSYLINHPRFTWFATIRELKEGKREHDLIVTLPERKEKVKGILEDLGYQILNE